MWYRMLETRDEGRGTRDEGQGTRDKGRGTRDKGREPETGIWMEFKQQITNYKVLTLILAPCGGRDLSPSSPLSLFFSVDFLVPKTWL